jgi:hypothetical protein
MKKIFYEELNLKKIKINLIIFITIIMALQGYIKSHGNPVGC